MNTVTFTSMQATRIPYRKTSRFSELVCDYLDENPQITSFFGEVPNIQGFKRQVGLKEKFPSAHRQSLVTSLKDQYACLPMDEQARASLHERIEKLIEPHTYTVTTGHQLCLFTGPLYTVYKILHVIRLAEELTDQLDGVDVLPVFWMATEDHDFDEINHIRHQGHKLTWHHELGDAVGRMKTHAIKPVIDDLQSRLPEGAVAENLISELTEAYLGQENLADATRAIVQKWFGKYGILILDGDDPALKRQMIPAFSKEIKRKVSNEHVGLTNKKLSKVYDIQVTPREINLFYLNQAIRSRVVQEGDTYRPLSGQIEWTEDEIIAELEAHPERFSPNVLMRPLFQETILPNLGYIGGGGEVAYWAQLKDMFKAFDIPFPIVALRQSIQLVPRRIVRKIENLNIDLIDLFRDYHELSKELIKANCDYDLDLEAARQKVEAIYADIAKLAEQVDKGLLRHADAQKTKVLNSLDNTEKKMFRAAKRNYDDMLRMLRECMNVLFPGGGLQERHDNIIAHMMQFGPDLIDQLYKQIKPLDFGFISLAETP